MLLAIWNIPLPFPVWICASWSSSFSIFFGRTNAFSSHRQIAIFHFIDCHNQFDIRTVSLFSCITISFALYIYSRFKFNSIVLNVWLKFCENADEFDLLSKLNLFMLIYFWYLSTYYYYLVRMSNESGHTILYLSQLNVKAYWKLIYRWASRL